LISVKRRKSDRSHFACVLYQIQKVLPPCRPVGVGILLIHQAIASVLVQSHTGVILTGKAHCSPPMYAPVVIPKLDDDMDCVRAVATDGRVNPSSRIRMYGPMWYHLCYGGYLRYRTSLVRLLLYSTFYYLLTTGYSHYLIFEL